MIVAIYGRIGWNSELAGSERDDKSGRCVCDQALLDTCIADIACFYTFICLKNSLAFSTLQQIIIILFNHLFGTTINQLSFSISQNFFHNDAIEK